jgi:hypothetical protein
MQSNFVFVSWYQNERTRFAASRNKLTFVFGVTPALTLAVEMKDLQNLRVCHVVHRDTALKDSPEPPGCDTKSSRGGQNGAEYLCPQT